MDRGARRATVHEVVKSGTCLSMQSFAPVVYWSQQRTNTSLFLLDSESEIQSCPTLCDPMDYTVHGILQARIMEWVAFPFSKGSSKPRDRTQVSCIAEDPLPAEPQGKPKNTGVGSLSLLQQIFPTQELNQGLLHCRQILYQLKYQGSPFLYE